MDDNWTILNTIKWLTGYLEQKGVNEARLNAEHLIAHTLRLKRLDIYLQFERNLSKDELASLKKLIERRAKREPLQYVIGTQPFRNVDIKVTKDVLIPRPETEYLVEEVIKYIPSDAAPNILEIGVGSGAILASICEERKNVSASGTEISPAAIQIAKENILPYHERIQIFEGNLFEPVAGKKFDIIVSNPPYIPESIWETLEPEIRDYEPKRALVGGKDGLDFLRRIVHDAPGYLRDGGRIFLEIGDGQKESVIRFADDCKSYNEIEVKKDLSGKERIFQARLL